jgi:L-alanine-DL-glutamate epimerase-like enolase superfamily enzyme
MRITDITITRVSFGALESPFWNSIVKTTESAGGRVEVHTDEGVVGIAPTAASAVRRAHVLGPIRSKLVGADPFRIGQLWDLMYMGGTRKPVAKGEYITSMSAVDNALWDLVGKSVDQPVWKLAGGVQSRVAAYAAGGYYEDGKGIPELCDELAGYAATGFRAVKMKVGWPGVTLRHDADRVRAVRNAIGPDVELMVDANNAWDAQTALRFGRMIEEYDPYWFEEPVRADDFRGGALLVEKLDVPIASGENEFTRWGARDLIDARAADIIQLDPNMCGGISEWLKVAALASAYYLKISPHGNPHIGSCCVAAVDNGLITENYPTAFKDRLMEPVDFRSDGYIYMSNAPGLGIEWDEDAIQRHRVD